MIRPINDWILVKMDPVETRVGSIYVPDGVDHYKATVVSSGPGKELSTGVRQPTELVPGDRVVFSRAHGEHKQGKLLLQMLGSDHLLIKPSDVLFAFEGDVVVS
jgi:co-chaperonin GroES (HSP10)